MMLIKRIKKSFIFLFLIFFCIGCGHAEKIIKLEQETEEPILVPVENEFELPILLFHHIGKIPASTAKDSYVWYVSEDYFEKVLQYIEDNDYQAITMSEMLSFVEKGKMSEKAIALVFDDGAVDFYDNTYPLLKKYNIKATVNAMTHVHSKDWINDEQILEMYKSGLVDFQSHGMYHPYLTRISKDEAKKELKNSKEYLENLLGRQVEVIAYPFGLYNKDIISIAEKLGYKAGLTLHSGSTQEKNNLFELKRIIVQDRISVEKMFAQFEK